MGPLCFTSCKFINTDQIYKKCGTSQGHFILNIQRLGSYDRMALYKYAYYYYYKHEMTIYLNLLDKKV